MYKVWPTVEQLQNIEFRETLMRFGSIDGALHKPYGLVNEPQKQ